MDSVLCSVWENPKLISSEDPIFWEDVWLCASFLGREVASDSAKEKSWGEPSRRFQSYKDSPDGCFLIVVDASSENFVPRHSGNGTMGWCEWILRLCVRSWSTSLWVPRHFPINSHNTLLTYNYYIHLTDTETEAESLYNLSKGTRNKIQVSSDSYIYFPITSCNFPK